MFLKKSDSPSYEDTLIINNTGPENAYDSILILLSLYLEFYESFLQVPIIK